MESMEMLKVGGQDGSVRREALRPHLACIPPVRHLLSQSYWVPAPSPHPNGPLLPIAAGNRKRRHAFLAPLILPRRHKAPLPSALFSRAFGGRHLLPAGP
ncbi:unnamed protein product [Rangifer tarandus platyrhynchus]|uniref:Uncharacterized protein n=2 Tax=Rangifer tarandus platyrhynchus TaxID=3082113 RepID=A0ACB0EQA9_RANTA|nr:unnamed protein product [Rangifer tarandus platyrhynchus]CAI9702962.1 unnamed protein product [Rangifer tarandus platyrhynchus]